MIAKKIILGSANVNSLYGLAKNNIKSSEFSSLMNFAFKKGVKIIDTSPMYSNSEKIIGKSVKKFYVISKIPKIPQNIKNINLEAWIKKKFFNSKEKMKKKIYGILIQNAEILLSDKADIVYDTLLNLKKTQAFEKIGISIYNFKTLELVIKKFAIDFVQLPYNILDQRFSKKKIIKILKKNKIEIHARSIFLQGLLTNNKVYLPKKLSKLENGLKKWRKWIKEKNINPAHACIDFVLRNKNIDKLVIGFNSKNNFADIIKFKKTKLNFNNLNIKISHNLLDPRRW